MAERSPFGTAQFELVRHDPVLVDGLRDGCWPPDGNAGGELKPAPVPGACHTPGIERPLRERATTVAAAVGQGESSLLGRGHHHPNTCTVRETRVLSRHAASHGSPFVGTAFKRIGVHTDAQ